MRYFKLSQDRRIPYGVLLSDVDKIDGYYESKSGDLFNLPDVVPSSIAPSPLNFYPDILDRQFFMVKGAVKEVFDMFLPKAEYKHCCLLDNSNSEYFVYYIPVLDVMKLSEGLEHGGHIFRIAGTKEIEVAASLAAAEAVLRRKPVGVRVSCVD